MQNACFEIVKACGLTAALLLIACSNPPNARSIIDAAIAAHGGPRNQSSIIEFDFRERHYTVRREGGRFTYTRSYQDSAGSVQDVLNNDGFYREIYDLRSDLSPRDSSRFSNSLNSVIYFALLPFPLLDPAVKARHLGADTIAGEKYHEIEVTFDREGGGKDYEDTFVYWINQKTHTMDYLAYTFSVGRGGTRFRQAFNRRSVGGIRFADYYNFRGTSEDTVLADYDRLFEEGKLTKVSEIILENVRVELLSN